MRTHDQEWGELTAEQREVLDALMSYPTKTTAAKALGISRPALYRKLQKDDELREAYEEARAQAIADATDSLQNIAEQSVAVLHRIANDPGVVPTVRVAAASKILDMALKPHELQDVLTRLETLEKELV
jgi:hypothetical protein